MPKKIEKPEKMEDDYGLITYHAEKMDTYLEAIADEALNVLFKIKS